MARLYIFAEGTTEQTFADTLLKNHLAKYGVYLHPPVLIAHAKKRGRVHRGGGSRYLPMKNDILRFLAQEKGSDVFFTTMIDLYSLHSGFPGSIDAAKLAHVPYDRVTFLEESFSSDIGDARFIPYIQLHEYEAYLFSEPKWFGYFYDHHENQIRELQAMADSCHSPELIDDGQDSAPSKRLIRQFPDYGGAKSVVGPQVAELIGLDSIRTKCPHFAEWLRRLENLE